MLVLSRRPQQKVVFSNLGISIQILRVAGKSVQLGIDAPQEFRILRQELADDQGHLDERPFVLTQERRHRLRNRLNIATLGLHVLYRQLQEVELEEAESVIERVLHEFQRIEAELEMAKPPSGGSNSLGTDGMRSRSGRRALIVEDNANESELLAAYLKMSGYEVDKVGDGVEALSYLKSEPLPDAVLLDMCMPKLDGTQTIDSIRSEPNWSGIKVFAVSGAERQQLGVQLGPAGVDEWFAKPVNAPELVRKMNEALGDALLSA